MRISIDRLFFVLFIMIALRETSLQSADLVQNGGFETGGFSPWTLSGSTNNTFISIGFPHSGGRSVLFGSADTPEFISQSLATSPGQVYSLSLWMGSGNNGGGTPNEFIVKWGDTTLLDASNLVIPDWTNMQFAVTANSSITVLSFGGWNNQDYTYLDDVSVTIPGTQSAPTFLNTTNASGLFQFTWSATVGRAYQLQYRPDPAQGAWLDLGSSITATNTTMTGSDSMTTNPQRFYRIVLLP